ncbi:MAG: chorismate mutase [Schleiferilactobacillus harbinensis]|jgi:chorismate mutase|nr:chorismate mutase [Schleiferilactobacillus harbinensis]
MAEEETNEELKKWRDQINAVDAQIVPLLAKRLAAAKQIAQVKYTHQLALTNRGREKEILETLASSVNDETLAPYIRELYQDVFLVSKQYQAKVIKGLQDQEKD